MAGSFEVAPAYREGGLRPEAIPLPPLTFGIPVTPTFPIPAEFGGPSPIRPYPPSRFTLDEAVAEGATIRLALPGATTCLSFEWLFESGTFGSEGVRADGMYRCGGAIFEKVLLLEIDGETLEPVMIRLAGAVPLAVLRVEDWELWLEDISALPTLEELVVLVDEQALS
jgi:hypothetical protein